MKTLPFTIDFKIQGTAWYIVFYRKLDQPLLLYVPFHKMPFGVAYIRLHE